MRTAKASKPSPRSSHTDERLGHARLARCELAVPVVHEAAVDEAELQRASATRSPWPRRSRRRGRGRDSFSRPSITSDCADAAARLRQVVGRAVALGSLQRLARASRHLERPLLEEVRVAETARAPRRPAAGSRASRARYEHGLVVAGRFVEAGEQQPGLGAPAVERRLERPQLRRGLLVQQLQPGRVVLDGLQRRRSGARRARPRACESGPRARGRGRARSARPPRRRATARSRPSGAPAAPRPAGGARRGAGRRGPRRARAGRGRARSDSASRARRREAPPRRGSRAPGSRGRAAAFAPPARARFRSRGRGRSRSRTPCRGRSRRRAARARLRAASRGVRAPGPSRPSTARGRAPRAAARAGIPPAAARCRAGQRAARTGCARRAAGLRRARGAGERARRAKSLPGKRRSSHCSTSGASSGPSASSCPWPAVRSSSMPR